MSRRFSAFSPWLWCFSLCISCIAIDAHAVPNPCPDGQIWVGSGGSRSGCPNANGAPASAVADSMVQCLKQRLGSSSYSSPRYKMTGGGTILEVSIDGYRSDGSFDDDGTASHNMACEVPQCEKQPGEEAGYFNTSGAPVCWENCEAVFTNWGMRLRSGFGTTQVAHYVYTGGSCSPEPDAPIQVTPGQDCAVSKDGKEVCLGDGGPEQKNCGLVNGETVCTEQTQCGTVNGEEVCIEDTGCGTVNGNTVCPDENADTDVCVTTESGTRFCLDEDGTLDDPQNRQTQDDKIEEVDDDGDPAGTGPIIFIMGGSGADDDGDGQPDGGGGGGGDGTGTGDGECDPETEECGDGLTGSATSCDDIPQCSDADAILCAVLRQVHKSQCETFAPGERFEQEARQAVGLPSSDEAAIGALYQGPSEIAEFAALVGINIPDAPGGACPAPLTFVAFGETREFPLDPICEFLSYLSVFVVFGAVFAGLRIAIKG